MDRDARLTFRLALGAAALGYERLLAELHATAAVAAAAPPRPSARHAVIGGLVATTAALAVAVGKVRAWLPPPPARLRRRLAAWTSTGQAEEAAARALATAVLARVNREVLERMTESDQVQHLVEEHSAGLTRAMVDELRDRTAHGDDRVERLVRRLFRRT